MLKFSRKNHRLFEIVLAVVCTVVVVCEMVDAADRITGTVFFSVFQSDQNRWIPLTDNDADFVHNNCDPKGDFAIIVHGWREGYLSEWVNDVASNFSTYRGGCVMLMSYGNDSRIIDYFSELMPHFNSLAEALANHLRRLERVGFDPGHGHMFGFSFGSHLALEAGRRFGFQKLDRIDTCDNAGPGFDSDTRYSLLDPKLAAKKVQCIHTSANYGSRRRDCHINWNMGVCGRDQPAAGPFPKGSHGLCPYFYSSAFTHNFNPIPKPKSCSSHKYAHSWPRGLRMGYFCDMNSELFGELFSPTTKSFPYNDDTILNEV
ncbi:hepatic triacylglycerol lipase-like [Toxorhynchites rutilus septentrionalis]|uniref:hepatic triacylglycerol lipase-like n=1 Tax=Toxorhynchites rutilus septentrionalis TaxID=329112 RepID=UPI002479AB11|nr:hepatic triacylglycerol lipase-like [Toxorhynchites rutilus septentrionalis]